MTDRAALFAALLALFLGACRPSPPDPTSTASPQPRATPTPTPLPTFRSTAALGHATHLAGLGPRIPESPAALEARAYLVTQLETLGWRTSTQNFEAPTPEGTRAYTNIVARFAPDPKAPLPADPPILLAAHYDTMRAHGAAGPGANDGASGPAVILEIATVLAASPALARQVEIAFFDGREPLRQFSAADGLYGSRFHLSRPEALPSGFRMALILGMVGGTDAYFTLPPDTPPTLLDRLREVATATGCTDRITAATRPLWDDHLPFLQAGIPTLLLTDAGYPYVRTADDTAARLDAPSLDRAGNLALQLIAAGPPPTPATPQPLPTP